MKKYLFLIFAILLFKYPIVYAKEITLDEFENDLRLERAYVVCNHVFDISKGYNPTLKDLLIAASYCKTNDVNVYEIKISQNINDEKIYEFRELLTNTKLLFFPKINVKYIYYDSIGSNSYDDIDEEMNLIYNNSSTEILNKQIYENLNINRAYVIGEYIFNLDKGFNPSLKDLLIAATTINNTDDIKVYELKKSENILGVIIEEYNELLSNKNIEQFPIIKPRYIYSTNIENNEADYIIKLNDEIALEDKNYEYTGQKQEISDGIAKSGTEITYYYYDDDKCNGNILSNIPADAGKYSVKAVSKGNEYYSSASKCIKYTINKSETITQLENIEQIYTGNVQEIGAGSSTLKSNNSLINTTNYSYKYYSDSLCSIEINNPTNIGKYYVQAILQENNNYNSSVSNCAAFDIVYDEDGNYSLTITPQDMITGNPNNLLSIERFTGNVIDDTWNILQEYDGTENRGSSRFTIKVDKDFISVNNYYDITIEYYDAGIGTVLLQTSTDQFNSINYQLTGYGGYPEESFWSWNDEYYYANLTFNLTNTMEWKSYTFKVTKDFFSENVDNYIHFYFGRSVNFNDILKIKSITVTKKTFNIDSIDKNNINNDSLIGNIYTNDNFGMGFKIYNNSNKEENIKLSYKVLDMNNNLIYNSEYYNLIIKSKDEEKFYLENIFEYGTYKLIVDIWHNNILEQEILNFSKIIADLSSNENTFLGMNSFFGYSGWTSERRIKNTIEVGNLLGINNLRENINVSFINEDKINGYNNRLGRYEDIYDSVLNEYNQNILFTVHQTSKTYEEILTETIDTYEEIAKEYNNKLEYYEILNEMNLVNELTPEQYANILVKVSLAIKNIDSDAKIVAIASNRIPIYANDDFSKYSEESWIAKMLNTAVELDNNNDGINDSTIYPIEIIDVVSVHPYTTEFSSPTSQKNNKTIFNQLDDLRNLIDYYKNKVSKNVNIPIWLTEAGFPTVSYDSNEEKQATYLTQMLIWSLANKQIGTTNIEKVYIYALQDTGFTNNHVEGNFGIVSSFKTENLKGYPRDVEMSAKPAYVSINMFSYLLNDVVLIEKNENEYYYYKFKDNNGNEIISIWLDEENPIRKISLGILNGNVTIYDMYGNILKEYINCSEEINVDINYMPIYITITK